MRVLLRLNGRWTERALFTGPEGGPTQVPLPTPER